jgi:hypothetical protein
MAKVELKVVLPVKREDGADVTVDEIDNVVLASKLTSAPEAAWSDLGPPTDPTTPEFLFNVNNVAPGSWDYRATFKDALGGPDVVAVTTLVVAGRTVSPLQGGSITARVVA